MVVEYGFKQSAINAFEAGTRIFIKQELRYYITVDGKEIEVTRSWLRTLMQNDLALFDEQVKCQMTLMHENIQKFARENDMIIDERFEHDFDNYYAVAGIFYPGKDRSVE